MSEKLVKKRQPRKKRDAHAAFPREARPDCKSETLNPV